MGPLASMAVQAGTDLGMAFLNRHWAVKDYAKQRADSLADWNMQNAYNSPQQQMQRLKEAGLNPNLVYGNGSVVANSQAMPRASNIAPTRADVRLDPQSEILKYQNIKQTQQTTDNLKKQGDILETERKLKEAQILALNKRTDRTVFDLARDKYLQDNGMLDYQLDTMGAKLSNIEARTRFIIDQNQRQELMNAKNLQYVTSKIGQIQLQNTLVPLQRQQIQENVNKLRQEISQQNIKFPQQMEALRLLNENQTYKNMLEGRTIGTKEDLIKAEKDIKDLELSWKKAGLKPTYVSDMINLIFGNILKH